MHGTAYLVIISETRFVNYWGKSEGSILMFVSQTPSVSYLINMIWEKVPSQGLVDPKTAVKLRVIGRTLSDQQIFTGSKKRPRSTN
jgi:hypothetical protein